MTKYIIFLLLITATAHDKQAIKTKWKAAFRDTVEIDVSDLGQERLIVNTNKVYWRFVVSNKALQDKGVDLSNITPAKFDAWKNANLDNPNHFQIATGDNWSNVLATAGFEPVPYTGPWQN